MVELRMRTKRPEDLTYGSLIGSRKPCCAFFTGAVAMFAMTFISSFFSLSMMHQFHISNLNIAYVYMAMTSSYAVSTIFASMYFRAIPRRRQQIFSLMLLTFGVMLRSGGHILQFFPRDTLWVITLGMAVTGLAAGPCYVTALPEAIETYKL